MHYSDLPPFSIAQYNKDILIEFVRHKTGWEERHEVSDKKQLNYLCNYLENENIGCKSIIIENEYIDRHYLEDYSEYYARCFPSHPRKCSRLHFFSKPISEAEFIEGISEYDPAFVANISEDYLGFAVIRPIPHTFLAKLCLKPFPNLLAKSGYKLIKRVVPVSLFGLPLEIETTPFLEQDKVVSACATSALWTALSISPNISLANLPSPSAITKSASLKQSETRTFPTIGLNPIQVACSLKHYGFEPTIYTYQNQEEFDDLKEHVFSYVTNDIPLIIGGTVYRLELKQGSVEDGQDNKAVYRHLGRHLICAIGCQTGYSNKSNGMPLLSHNLDKLYVHDDRYGPFLEMDMKTESFIDGKGRALAGFKLLIGEQISEIFVPEVSVVGLYHKVRIPYIHIREICESLFNYLRLSLEDIETEIEKNSVIKDKEPHHEVARKCIKQCIEGVWEISLTTSTVVKEEARKSKQFATFNGDTNKTKLLFQSMPKYIWRCRMTSRDDKIPVRYTDILFDATEIHQGHVLIGYIAHNEIGQSLWNYVESLITDRVWQNYNISDDLVKQSISCIIKFFNEPKGMSYLNSLYGSLGLPKRPMKQGETDNLNYIQLRKDIHTIRRGSLSPIWDALSKEKKYIWVINDMGDMVLGEDIEEEAGYKGHPTLLDGKPGRIAGEIFFCSNKKSWLINHQSRAYSGHFPPGSAAAQAYLKHVIDNNLKGIIVEILESGSKCSTCTKDCKRFSRPNVILEGA